jgi:S1-C subfamily serine protease
VGPHSFEVTRSDLTRALERIEGFLASGVKLALLVPAKTAEGRVGIKVFGVEPTAPCGLELGDTVLAVNGIPVTDDVRLAAERPALLRGPRFSVELERAGSLLELSYRLTPDPPPQRPADGD